MLEKRTLARPYAKAIFEIARATEDYKAWSKLLSMLVVIAKNSQVIFLLRDRGVSPETVSHFFFEVLGSHLDAQAKNLIKMLAERRRLELLPEIADLFHEMHMQAENSVEVDLKTPFKLSSEEKKKFEKILEKYLLCQIILHCHVDKEMLGGFFARAGNFVIDGSVRGYLTNLKEVMGD